jgi:hypothetical protein
MIFKRISSELLPLSDAMKVNFFQEGKTYYRTHIYIYKKASSKKVSGFVRHTRKMFYYVSTVDCLTENGFIFMFLWEMSYL